MTRVAAVIVTFNNPRMLRDLLGDLAAQSRPPDEIVVVDNASSDGTEQAVSAHHPCVSYVRLAENIGSAGGYYAGIRTAATTADLIWTLDDDVRLETRSLELLVQGLETISASGRIGAVRSVGAGHPLALPTELDIVPWRGTLFPTEVIRAAGLPGREYFIYGEDLEYSLRLKRLGYSFYWIPASRCVESRKGKVGFSVLGRPGEAYPTAWALYYAFRNEVSIYLKYRGYARLLRTMLYALKLALHVCVAERARCTGKLAAIARGLRDGCLHRLGKNERYLP